MKEDELIRAYGLEPQHFPDPAKQFPVPTAPCASPRCMNRTDVTSRSIFCDDCFRRLMDRLGDG